MPEWPDILRVSADANLRELVPDDGDTRLYVPVTRIAEEKAIIHAAWSKDTHEKIAANTQVLSAATDKRQELETALREAIQFADEGWAYATNYMREKWNYEGERARLLAVLGAPSGECTCLEGVPNSVENCPIHAGGG